MLALGKLTSSFGVKGGIKVKSFSGEVNHFKKLVNQIVLLKQDNKEISIKVSACEIKGEIPVLYFDGYDAPEKVKVLNGFELWADRKFASKLEKDEFYMSDLVGLSLVFEGKTVGSVVSFMETSSMLLEVKSVNGDNFWVPFINHFIGTVDLDTKTIELINDECL